MNDRLLVDALLSGDPGALDALYDAHAHRLYAYCWFLARRHDIAQVAVRDALIVAAGRLAELPDPGRFGVWLYALARNECARRRSTGPAGPDTPVATPDQDDVDLRVLAWRAVSVLDPQARELLELRIRHRLSPDDLADVLQLAAETVRDRLDQARDLLEAALVAEVLAHRQPYECAERRHILSDRRGDLTGELRARLLQHARDCATCVSYGPRPVSAAKVYGLLPWPDPPETLRIKVMSCFGDPELSGYRAFAADRAGTFGRNGFPVSPARSGWRRLALARTGRRRGRRAVTGIAAALIAIALAGAGLHWFGGRFEGRHRGAGGVAAPGGTAGSPPAGTRGPYGLGPLAGEVPVPGGSVTFPLGARASAAPPTAPGARGGPGTGGRGFAAPSPRPAPGVPPHGPAGPPADGAAPGGQGRPGGPPERPERRGDGAGPAADGEGDRPGKAGSGLPARRDGAYGREPGRPRDGVPAPEPLSGPASPRRPETSEHPSPTAMSPPEPTPAEAAGSPRHGPGSDDPDSAGSDD